VSDKRSGEIVLHTMRSIASIDIISSQNKPWTRMLVPSYEHSVGIIAKCPSIKHHGREGVRKIRRLGVDAMEIVTSIKPARWVAWAEDCALELGSIRLRCKIPDSYSPD
jgi:hypothetical protein